MSQPRLTNTRPSGVKPNADRYTVLLLIALIAMIVGCVLLYLELGEQGVGAFSRLLPPKCESIADAFRASGVGHWA
ncbi:MAG: hypothetical protein FWC43_08090 [Planctomycetaceae bacterium]|nr:hypothetical protein [Planctomycetaceae bacterium]